MVDPKMIVAETPDRGRMWYLVDANLLSSRSQTTPPESEASKAKDQVIAALRRRLDELKQTVANKDAELRRKQREIDQLYGKLAAGSKRSEPELSQKLQEVLLRLAVFEHA